MKLFILYVIFSVRSFCFAAEDDFQNEHKKTVINYLNSSDSCVLVAVFKSEWIPANKQIPKGRMISYGRVARVFKGSFKVGDKIKYTALVEEAPKWLKYFVRQEEADLFFIVVDKKNANIENDLHDFIYGSQWAVSYNDTLYSNLIKKELGIVEK